jgi:hypothetical protein
MGRRSRESGHTAKQRRSTIRPKVRKAAAGVADLRQQLNRRTLELEDAVQQQMATGEVLSIIRQSPADAQPVFDAIVQSASRLCGALFGVYIYATAIVCELQLPTTSHPVRRLTSTSCSS